MACKRVAKPVTPIVRRACRNLSARAIIRSRVNPGRSGLSKDYGGSSNTRGWIALTDLEGPLDFDGPQTSRHAGRGFKTLQAALPSQPTVAGVSSETPNCEPRATRS